MEESWVLLNEHLRIRPKINIQKKDGSIQGNFKMEMEKTNFRFDKGSSGLMILVDYFYFQAKLVLPVGKMAWEGF